MLLKFEWQIILCGEWRVWVSEFGWISKVWMCIIVWVSVGLREFMSVCTGFNLHRDLQSVGSYYVYKCASACAYICIWVCVSDCVQLSQVCVINQLSGQFICWVTSCNFPPDSGPLCQVGITLSVHDKTLHLSASLPLFFALKLESLNSPSRHHSLISSSNVPLPFLSTFQIFPSFSFSFSRAILLSLPSSVVIFLTISIIILKPWSKKGGLYN